MNRLPPEFYPSVNGRDYLNQVIARNKKLEDNLERYQGKKKEFHQRIESLIKDGFLKYVGKWKDLRYKFEGVQEKGAENLLLPWQLVQKDEGTAILAS